MVPHDSIIRLQQTIGNQALQMLMRSKTGLDFAKTAVQAKLMISQPGDIYEQEADRVAEQVMRMPSSNSIISSTISKEKDEERIDRKCSACEMKKEEEEEKEIKISTKPVNRIVKANSELLSNQSSSINWVLSKTGKPLDKQTEDFMEPRFGYEFTSVRIHNDEEASKSAQMINASAYTVGNDIVFARGEFNPSSDRGKSLLAHELVHVIQQTNKNTISKDKSIQHLKDHSTGNDGPPYVNVSFSEPKIHRSMSQFCIETGSWSGNLEHVAIQQDYNLFVNPTSGAFEFTIPTALPSPQGSTSSLGRADIVDLAKYSIYEIKPYSGKARGLEEVAEYVRNAKLYCDPDAPWNPGKNYPDRVIPYNQTTELVAKQWGNPGVILYHPRRRITKEESEALSKLSAEVEKLQNQINQSSGDHKAQADLIYKPSFEGFAGFWTNRLFNKDVPLLLIWNDAHSAVAAAQGALKRRDIVKALGHFIRARRAYLVALKQYTTWKDGIQGAGVKMQLAIGASAVAAVLAFVAPAAVKVVADTLAAGTATAESTVAAEQMLARIATSAAKADSAILAAEVQIAELEEMEVVQSLIGKL